MTAEELPTQPEAAETPVLASVEYNIEAAEEEPETPRPYDVTAILCGMAVFLVLLFVPHPLKMQYIMLSGIGVTVISYIILEILHPPLPYLPLAFIAGVLGFLLSAPRQLYINWQSFDMILITVIYATMCGVLSIIIAVWIDTEENPYQALIASFLVTFALTNFIVLSLAIAAQTAV